MTIQNYIPLAVGLGAGTALTVAVASPFHSVDQIRVYLVDNTVRPYPADPYPTETLLTRNVDYTITTASIAGSSPPMVTGSVTTISAVSATQKIAVLIYPLSEQTADLTTIPYSPIVHEKLLDLAAMRDARQDELDKRTPRFPLDYSGPQPRFSFPVAGRALLWDAATYSFVPGPNIGDVAAAQPAAAAAAASAAAAAASAAAAQTFDPANFYTKVQADTRYYTSTATDTLFSQYWKNTKTVKTANYTVLDADHAKSLTLSGNALFQLTLGAIAGYRSNFLLFVMNEDTRGKVIQLGAQQAFILWPGQSIIIVSGGSDWICHGRNQKFKLNGYNSIVRFYVDPINGAPSGPAYVDGLATSGAGCFKYVNDAIANLVNNCDANNNMPYIRVVNNISGEQANFQFSGQMQGSCQITIEGGPQSGEDPIRWVATANNQTFVQARDNCILTIVHFDFDHGTFTGGSCLNPSQNGVIDYRACWFGPCIGGSHIFIDQGGSCNNLDIATDYKVYGMATSSTTANTYHIQMAGPSKYNAGGATIQMPNNLFCAAWLFIQGPAFYNTAFLAFSGAGAGSGTTGAKYGIGYNGVAFLNGSILPGATAGSFANGGLVKA